MATQRTLKLNLLADVDKFGKGLDKAGRDAQGFSGKVKKYGKIAAKALAGVAAAAGIMAIKLGVDAVKGAVEDEISQKKLATALRNTTKATDEQIASTEDYISKTQLRYGITDVKLRTSLGNLLRATQDVTQAQKLNNLAVDIAAGTGKDLETISLALARAYGGNIGALKRLGIPLDDNIIKTKDFEAATDELQKLFGGSALANTETLEGKLAILRETFGELQEGVGQKFIPVLKNLLDNIMLVSKGFSGEDPEGLTARARELAGEYNGNGANTLGGSLRAVVDAFANLFGTITEDGDPATNSLTQFAESIERIADGLDTLATNWNKVTAVFRFIQNPLNLNVPEAGFTPRPAGMATGGSVMGGRPYRVGEFSSEVFIPSGSGSIRPDRSSGGNTFIFNGVIDGESARRSIERVLQNSAKRTAPINLVGSTL
jgi:hypothetical protein